MKLTVQPNLDDPSHGHLACGGAVYDCALGKAGITSNKQEGDGATPIGQFALKQVYYRADRVETPRTGLPLSTIKANNGWCDAPADSNYNRLVQHPYPASAERLWREDHRYDLIVVLGHNDNPVVPGAGSAIFIHIAAEDFRPTEGCIALREEDLLAVMSQCTTDSTIEIQTATP